MVFNNISKDMWAKLENQPLSPPPEGVTPNFQHPAWHGHKAVIASSVCVPIMILMGTVRVYSKVYITRRWAWDDSIFLLSLVAAFGYVALALAVVCGGAYGYDAWEVTVGDLTKPVLVRSLLLITLMGPLIWFIKLAVFSLIYLAFRPLLYIRVLVFVGVLITGLYHISAAIVTGIFCGPHSGQDRASYLAPLTGRKCFNSPGTVQVLNVTSGVVNLVCDFYLLVLPLPAILKLNLPRKKKMGVLLIFLTGLGGCVMSALALYYRHRAYGHEITMRNRDVTYSNVTLLTVNIMESTVGIVIPCMAPLVKVCSRAWSLISTRCGGFRRTASSDNTLKASNELRPYCKASKNADLDTIDKMMLQIGPSVLESHHSEKSHEEVSLNEKEGTRDGVSGNR